MSDSFDNLDPIPFPRPDDQPVPVFKNMIKGILAGAAVGYGVHHARQVEKIRQTLDQIRDVLEPDESATDTSGGFRSYLWSDPKQCLDLYRRYTRNIRRDEFGYQSLELKKRWRRLVQRCLDHDVCPLRYMPRSRAGDIVGTYEMLSERMDELTERLDALDQDR